MLDRNKLDQIKLTLSRLNGQWSFIGAPLSWEVDVYLRPMPLNDSGSLLQAVTAYGCLAASAGDAQSLYGPPPAEWTRLFNNIGSALLFDLPDSLPLIEQRQFNKLYNKAFIEGWRGSPSSPSP